MLADGFVRESSVPLLVQIHTPELPGLVAEYEAAVLATFGRHHYRRGTDIRGSRLDDFLRGLTPTRSG